MGIAAFKVFMVVDTGRSYPHMPGIGVHHHGKLLEIFETIAPTGVALMVHPHDQELMDHIEHQFWDRGERDYRAYAKAYAAYDGIIWDTAAALLLRLQQATGTQLHLLHTQTKGVVEQLRAAKARGQHVSAEINPWAVMLGNDWANIERLGSYALSYWVPEENTEPLWAALRDGTIDLISTDHGPHTREEKEPGWTDGWKAHTGTPSAQFYVPMFLDAAANGPHQPGAGRGRHGHGAGTHLRPREQGPPRRGRGRGHRDRGPRQGMGDHGRRGAVPDRLDPLRGPADHGRHRSHAGAWRGRLRGRTGHGRAGLGQAGPAQPLSQRTGRENITHGDAFRAPPPPLR